MRLLKWIIKNVLIAVVTSALVLLIYIGSYHVLLYKSKQMEEPLHREEVTEMKEPDKQTVEPVAEPEIKEPQFTMMCDGCGQEVTDLQAATLPEGMRVLLCPSCLEKFEIKTRSEEEI